MLKPSESGGPCRPSVPRPLLERQGCKKAALVEHLLQAGWLGVAGRCSRAAEHCLILARKKDPGTCVYELGNHANTPSSWRPTRGQICQVVQEIELGAGSIEEVSTETESMSAAVCYQGSTSTARACLARWG